MKEMIRSLQNEESELIIDKLKNRVRYKDYLETEEREDALDYIAAKVKAQITPMLRLARSVRRTYYPKWTEFNKLLDYFNLQGTLTRENNYSPMPEWVINHHDSRASIELEDYIFFFNKLHEIEDERYEALFERAYEEWARPSLIYAFNKVDVSKTEKEIVSYVCKTFTTKYIELRAAGQGMRRKRRSGRWFYYYEKEVNEFDFRHNDIMKVIFHGEDESKFKELEEMAQLLTKRQTKLLIQLQAYVRNDVRNLNKEEFQEKYPHYKMNYTKTSEELGFKYSAFVKNISRIKQKIV
jgi:hypothetical protein